LINRNALISVGRWAGQYTGVEDYHLWLRLCAHYPLKLLNTVTIGRRIHNNSFYNQNINKFPLRRIKLRYDACKNAVDYLISNYSGNDRCKIETAKQRLRYYQDIRIFVESIINNDQTEIPKVVERISNYFESVSDKRPINLFGYLYYHFPQDHVEMLQTLSDLWPKEYKNTIKSLNAGIISLCT